MSIQERLEALPDQIEPRRATTVLLWTVAGFLILFVAWAAFAQIDRTVRAPGRVIATARLQILSNPEGGVLSSILVRPGEQVKAGQALLRLDPTSTGSELGSGEVSVMALEIKAARLKAEVLGQQPSYPYASDPRASELIAIERALHSARIAEISGLEQATSARAAAAARGVGEADSYSAARQAAARASASQLTTMRELVAKRLEPRMSLEQAEGTARVNEGEAAAASAAASRSRATAAEARAAALQARADWRARAADELAKVRADYESRQLALPALRARAERTVMRAPLAGRVNRLLVSTVGAAVAPGSPLLELAPAGDSLIVEAMVQPKDIARVRTGQPAKVNITAYESSVFGTLEGVVETVSPDAVISEDGTTSHYIVRIRTRGNAIVAKDGRKLPITAGMTADANLLGEKRSILSYLLTPITRLSETAFRE